MRRLAGFVFKDAKGTTLEKFQQDREKEFESKFKDSGTRTVRFIQGGRSAEVTIPEKELKKFARKVIGPNPEGAIADLSLEYGDILDTEDMWAKFIETIGVRTRYNLNWGDIISAVREKSMKFVRNNFQKIHELFSEPDGAMSAKRKIKELFKVSLFFTHEVWTSYTYIRNAAIAAPPWKWDATRVTHRKQSGQTEFTLPGNLNPILPRKASSVKLYTYMIQKVKQLYDSIGAEQAEEQLGNYSVVSKLSDKARKALLQYIIKNYKEVSLY